MESNSYKSQPKTQSKAWGWIIAIVIAAGIGVLIWWLVKEKGDGSRQHGDGSPSNWSPEQTENAKAQMGAAMPMSIKNCAIKRYSEDHSYDDFENKIDFQIELPNMLQKCLGDKGNWNSDLKKSLVNTMGAKLGNTCAKCVINTMEQTYDPMQFLVLSEKLTMFERTHPNVEWSNPPSDTPPDVVEFVKNMGMTSIKCKCNK